MKIGGLRVARVCTASDLKGGDAALCRLSIRKGKRIIWSAEGVGPESMQFGLFRFLRGKPKQLIVQTYSGGAHCCSDYYIFEARNRHLRTLYDSSLHDSANEIGNHLIPVDIDGDGTFEFYRDVMAFDYMGFAGHASATFPPAIFAFDPRTKKFVNANRRFSAFVLDQMKADLSNLKKWQREQNERSQSSPGSLITDDQLAEVYVRDRFLYKVYAGKEREAWPEFIREYRSVGGAEYQDEFREKFIHDFKKAFKTDPTYRAIYGK